jgi:glycolate oxidase
MSERTFETTSEIIRAAHALVSPPLWDYLLGGALTETTMRRNREAINALALQARVLRDVRETDASRTLLGEKLRIPYLCAPIGNPQAYAPDGGAAVVRGARRFGTIPVISSLSQPDYEITAAAAEGPKWFQLYTRGDRDWIKAIVQRAVDAGFTALVVTVDSAYFGLRERLIHTRSRGVVRRESGRDHQAALSWDDVVRIKSETTVPVILKGIQSAADAALAVEHGFDAVWVSNHGGRELDQGRGSMDVLRDVVPVVAGRTPIIVDGAFYRGTDVLKALAIGATAVATGRLYTMGLAVDGDEGVTRVLELIERELKNAMGLCGLTSLAQADDSYVAEMPYRGDHSSVFPTLPPEMQI